MADLDPFALSIAGVSDLIGSPVNKLSANDPNSPEGTAGPKVDVLDLPMTDEELLRLKRDWENAYAPYESKVRKLFERNLKAYLGKQGANMLPQPNDIMGANFQFEAMETFLAAALAQEPDPVVYGANNQESNTIADSVRTMLEFHADQLVLRRKFAQMVRQWAIYHLGVLKVGWDEEVNDVTIQNRKIQDFVFDPHGFVDAHGEFSSYLGERITMTAEKLIEMFPEHKDYIEESVSGEKGPQLGTKVTYTEWWTDEYCFTTYKERVLDKHKNEFFNYEEELDETSEMGQPRISTPINHFAKPKKPYIFLSVFSLQSQPHDLTSLLEQNISNQDQVSKTEEHLNLGVAQTVNGLAFSMNNFNQETAKQASNALSDPSKGKVLVPEGGPIGEAIVRIAAPDIQDGIFKHLENNINFLKSSWGIQGIASQPPKADTTARGMILNQSHDTSRIGGGIGDAVEQVARMTFNWLVQLYEVFYDEPHFAAILGMGKAVEYAEITSQMINMQLIVTVAPNSMRPKDKISEMNTALELYKMSAIGPKTLLESLEFPNPDEAAADGVLWKIAPQQYLQLNFPQLFQQLQQLQMQMMQAQMGAPPQMGAPQVPRPQPPTLSQEPANAQLRNVPIPK